MVSWSGVYTGVSTAGALPMYVPAVRLPTTTDICRLCGAAPEAGLTVSQVESLPAVKLKLPEPLLVRFTLAGAGFALLP